MLIFSNNCQFGSKFWISPDEVDAFLVNTHPVIFTGTILMLPLGMLEKCNHSSSILSDGIILSGTTENRKITIRALITRKYPDNNSTAPLEIVRSKLKDTIPLDTSCLGFFNPER